MAKKRVFISFDYDYDAGAKHMLAGQAKLPGSTFEFVDASVKEHLSGDWKDKVRRRMANVDLVLVLCGQKTDKATGVAAEVEIAQELGKKLVYFAAYSDKTCVLPRGAGWFASMDAWTWDNLKKRIG
jgi:hypothetical protein